MTADDKNRRRRLLALIALAFLSSATYVAIVIGVGTLRHRSIVAAEHRAGVVVAEVPSRQLLAATLPTPANKRVRAHRIVPTATATAKTALNSSEAHHNPDNSGGGGGGGGAGILVRDKQGLLVEVAASPPPAPEWSPSPPTIHQQTKIINGLPQSRASFPFIVRLHWTDPGKDADDSKHFSFCGGSLIAPDVVLTAAHCLGKYESHVDVYDVLEGRPRTYEIRRSVVHPGYERDHFGFDYGLILIEEPHLKVEVVNGTARDGGDGGDVEEDYWSLVRGTEYDWENAPPIVRPHRYPASPTETSTTTDTKHCATPSDAESEALTNLMVIGYGSTQFDPAEGPSDPSYHSLQGADVQYVTNDECDYRYTGGKAKRRVITDDQMCAMDADEGQDACSGDSGGPLVARMPTSGATGSSAPLSLWTQIGVVSWGMGCALSRYPGVYARIAEEISWIDWMICGAGGKDGLNGLGGMSPMSCVLNEDGKRRLRDYAMEASSSAVPNDAVASDVRKETLIDEDRQILSSASDLDLGGATSRKKVTAVSSLYENRNGRQQRLHSELCELLEGPSVFRDYDNEEEEIVATSPLTSSPTKRPTKPPRKTDRPTNKQRDPVNDNNALVTTMGTISATTGTTSTTTADTTCSNKNHLDVDSFAVGTNGRKRSCRWVKRRCRRRCREYSDCCPETCGRAKCRQ